MIDKKKIDRTMPEGISEDLIEIEAKEWDDDEVKTLWAREMLIFNSMRNYAQCYIERGRRLQDLYAGRIFTDEQRAVLEDVEGKICVEPRIMKAPIRALVGQLIKARRSGQITSEDGDLNDPNQAVAEIEVIDAVLKSIETKTGEKYLIRDAIHDCCVSCYPVITAFEKSGPSDGPCCGGYRLSAYPWDSTVVGPITFKRANEIREWCRLEFRSKGQLIENFPKMRKQILAHFETENIDDELISSIDSWSGDISSENRDQLYDIVKAGLCQVLDPLGYVPVIERLFPISKKQEVWENIFDDTGLDFKIKPENWTDARWQKWTEENKETYHGPYEREVRTLWVTTFTTTGLVLENRQHWYQENGALPGNVWIPAMQFGVPTGPADDMADDTIANAVAETEYLHDIRTGTGKLLAMIEGTVKNAEALATEATKNLGVIIMDQKVQNIDAALKEMVRTPNKMFKEYAEQRKASMSETTRINETLQGATAPRQAAVAKNIEIAQAFVVLALYIDNFNEQWEAMQNLKLSMIPYAMTEYEVLQILDENTNKPKVVEVNAPADTAIDEEGNVVVTRVINDITSRSYRWKIKPVDDSPAAKEQAMQEALVFINAASGPLINADPSGKFFARVLLAMPNIFLNQAGEGLAKDAEVKAQAQGEAEKQKTLMEAQVELMKAQAEVEKAAKAGVTVTFSGADLAQYPQLLKILGALQANQQAPQPPAGQPQPAPQVDTLAAPQPVQVGGPV
jgi:hypothetical protein